MTSVRAEDILNNPSGLQDEEVKGFLKSGGLSAALKTVNELMAPPKGPAKTTPPRSQVPARTQVPPRTAASAPAASPPSAPPTMASAKAKTKAALSTEFKNVEPSPKNLIMLRGAKSRTPRIKQQPIPVVSDADQTNETDCPQCGKAMRRGEIEFTCEDCGTIIAGDSSIDTTDGEAGAAAVGGRLRLVGPNAGRLQPDLDRSSSTDNATTQHRQLLAELQTYCGRYVERGGRRFPTNVLSIAADYYYQIQEKLTKRSDNKKAILAACVYTACLKESFSREKRECAEMLQLQQHGIARGANFIRALSSEKIVSGIPVDEDPCWANIVTAFSLLGLDSDEYEGLRRAVLELIQTSIEKKIEVKTSHAKTKAMGGTYVILRRYMKTLKGTVATDHPTNIKMSEFCRRCKIRKTTIETYIDTLNGYHSLMKPVYEKHKVFAGALNIE